MAEPAWIERAEQDAERACRLRACPQILEMPSSAAAVRGGRSQGWRSPPGLSERSRMRSARAAELDGISKICHRRMIPGSRYSDSRCEGARDGAVRAPNRSRTGAGNADS